MSLKSQLREAILNIWRKDTMIEELSSENSRLSKSNAMLQTKLDLAMQGLRNIKEYADTMGIAKKTVDETDSGQRL